MYTGKYIDAGGMAVGDQVLGNVWRLSILDRWLKPADIGCLHSWGALIRALSFDISARILYAGPEIP